MEEKDRRSPKELIAQAQKRVEPLREQAERTLLWKIWERMLEADFVDRSVALAGKAFVSFFPLIIVVAAFMPPAVRTSILSTLTHRLGVRGHSLALAKEAFASAADIRKATGILGLILTLFFSSSFTTALQRLYMRAWRRPRMGSKGTYVRGPIWLIAFLVYMALLGGVRNLLGNAIIGVGFFVLLSLALTTCWWWFTAWYLLLGQVRWRVLLPTALITTIAMGIYGSTASLWMSSTVEKNQAQFGFFGIALALITWFSGAAICLMIGACAGPTLAEDAGPIGRFIRGGSADLHTPGAPPSLPAPTTGLHQRDAFRPLDDDPVDESDEPGPV